MKDKTKKRKKANVSKDKDRTALYSYLFAGWE